MKKILLLLILVAVTSVIYSVVTNPEKKEQVLETIEKSTGVDLESTPEKLLQDAGKAAGTAADGFLKDLGNALTDPRFYKALERWGKDALNKLDSSELEKLKNDLKMESGKRSVNYNTVLEKYLGEGI